MYIKICMNFYLWILDDRLAYTFALLSRNHLDYSGTDRNVEIHRKLYQYVILHDPTSDLSIYRTYIFKHIAFISLNLNKRMI